jgi:hypothetical protein
MTTGIICTAGTPDCTGVRSPDRPCCLACAKQLAASRGAAARLSAPGWIRRARHRQAGSEKEAI